DDIEARNTGFLDTFAGILDSRLLERFYKFWFDLYVNVDDVHFCLLSAIIRVSPPQTSCVHTIRIKTRSDDLHLTSSSDSMAVYTSLISWGLELGTRLSSPRASMSSLTAVTYQVTDP